MCRDLWSAAMTQKNVELVLGRLITDGDFRRSFRKDPSAALEELAESGIDLNPVERRALVGLDSRLFEDVVSALSSRLQRVSFRPKPDEGEGRSA
jgi:hypothetical protein